MFSKKATKVDEIFTVDLTFEDFVNLCGLLKKHELYIHMYVLVVWHENLFLLNCFFISHSHLKSLYSNCGQVDNGTVALPAHHTINTPAPRFIFSRPAKKKMQIIYFNFLFLESLGFETINRENEKSGKIRLSEHRRSIQNMNGISGATKAGPMPHVSQ